MITNLYCVYPFGIIHCYNIKQGGKGGAALGVAATKEVMLSEADLKAYVVF